MRIRYKKGFIKLFINKQKKEDITMPKTKTRSSVKKRFTVTASGKLKRRHAYHSHILTKKSNKRKRALCAYSTVSNADAKVLNEMLGR